MARNSNDIKSQLFANFHNITGGDDDFSAIPEMEKEESAELKDNIERVGVESSEKSVSIQETSGVEKDRPDEAAVDCKADRAPQPKTGKKKRSSEDDDETGENGEEMYRLCSPVPMRLINYCKLRAMTEGITKGAIAKVLTEILEEDIQRHPEYIALMDMMDKKK